jgi:hypothetical protein
MGYSQSELFVDLCVNVTLVRPTRISPRQSGRGRRAMYLVPFGGARQGPDAIVGYVLQLAAPTGPSP